MTRPSSDASIAPDANSGAASAVAAAPKYRHSRRRRPPVRPGELDERRGGVVRVRELPQHAVGVHVVDEDVAARGQAGDLDVLAVEERPVAVDVADRRALLDVPHLRPPRAAVADEARRPGAGHPRDHASPAVDEAEAGLVVPYRLADAVRAPELVRDERLEVPVEVGLVQLVVHAAHARDDLRPSL